jgi:hypothetical protein
MPTEQNKALLTRMKIASDDGYMRVTPKAGTPPDAVSRLLKLDSADKLRAELVGSSEKVSDDVLSNGSKLPKDKGFYKLHNWASGGSPHRRFTSEAVTSFFEDLFTTLSAVSLSLTSGDKWWKGGHVKLSRADLFHGHLIWDTSAPFPDVLFLFHAKEYPSDIEESKSGHAKAIDSASYVDFKATSPEFKFRCSIYSLRTDRLHILKLSDNGSPYRSLVADPDLSKSQNPLRIDQDDLGVCVADVNYFPADGVRLFFCTRPTSS